MDFENKLINVGPNKQPMVDSRCYDDPGYWGKIGKGQSRLIIDEIVDLPVGGEYTILHLGCGLSPPVYFDSWLRCIYYTQFSEETHIVRGQELGLLSKRVNYFLSDLHENQPVTIFRSNITFLTKNMEDVVSGTQKYMQINAENIDFADSNLDVVLALGFFSAKVLKDSELTVIVPEKFRVLKQGGFLLTSVHEHYVSKLIDICEINGFHTQLLDISLDMGPDNPLDRKTRHLLRFEKI